MAVKWRNEIIRALAEVRGNAVRDADFFIGPECNAKASERLRSSGVDLASIGQGIPLLIDCALLAFLRAVDEGMLELVFRDSSGALTNLAEESKGELVKAFREVQKLSTERYFAGDERANP
jgi:hypothetical protein